jgi:hypothetical protein
MPTDLRRLAPILALVPILLLALVATTPVLPVRAEPPAAPLAAPDDDPAALRERLLEHRSQEAAIKTRRAEAWARDSGLRSPEQHEWDVHHYDLDLTLDPSIQTLSGTVTTTAELTGTDQTTFDLNLTADMTVSAVTLGGSPTTWSHPDNLLTVDLDTTYTAGQSVVIAVTYSGNPAGNSFGWSTFDGQSMIWTLSEPFGAREWWPCKDIARDKADSVDIRVTVPDHLYVASNGLLISDVDNGTTRTFHWKTNYPMSTYLVSLAIHPYTIFSHSYTPQGGGSPMPVDYYVFPSHYDDVQDTYALVVPMLNAFAQGYGEYPFVNEKYGHAEFVWGGGMEHQTLSSMGGWSEDLISHELAHQWWGDEVTCYNFKHIWLNEGFATWSEAYWKEQSDGFARYQQYMDGAAYYGPGTIYVENPQIDDIFDVNLTYNKASWIPHMIRHIVGETNFFDGLADYRSLYGHGNASTEDFRDVMEAASGIDLDDFFQQWIYGEYYPIYRYAWHDSVPGTLDLTIEQIQTNTGLFTLPIDVRVTTTTSTYDHVVQNSLALENYQIPVTGDVESVVLDPDRWILREVETVVTDPTFDQGLLVVNGVDWDTYSPEIQSAYADSCFWADLPFTFWDAFPEPASGYPANLPTPLGHGPVPGDLLGKFSAVVWVGNNFNGDLPKWTETPIESYLDVGGNVLLLSRRGQTFLAGDLTTYLGITWASTNITLNDLTAVHPSFDDIALTGTQNWNDVFSTTVGPNSTLLFQSNVSGVKGSGVIAIPPGGGTHRPDGGKLAHIAGRPYRMNHTDLRGNVETILKDFFGEPYSPGTGVDTGPARVPLTLGTGAPNPFRVSTGISFSLPAAGPAELTIYDVSGRLVRTLARGMLPAGRSSVTWDGRTADGQRVASGVYFVRLTADGESRVRPIVRLR